MLRALRLALLAGALATATAAHAESPVITVSYPAERSSGPLQGRLILVFATKADKEPRAQAIWDQDAIPIFGMDVEGWKPGEWRAFDATAYGFPLKSFEQLPPGKYFVQVVLNRYETFTLADGRRLNLPPDRGEGQVWHKKPGNLYSTPQEIEIGKAQAVALLLDQEIPAIEPFETHETAHVKYLRIKSERLSQFWGRDMYLGAWIHLPWGYAEHPQARYPLAIAHGHFPGKPGLLRETPPDPDLKPEYSKRFSLEGYNRTEQEYGWLAFNNWNAPRFPRVLMVEIQHPTPYYDDSYAVNSANNGPYGDAIEYELIPEIEKRFRAIGQGWARFVFGGSTGGWEAMAVQMFYPDHYNGAWVACPDPIDFRHYETVDLYRDTNAYYMNEFKRTPRPGYRNWLGHVYATIQEMNQYEYALGNKVRSGDQWDAWESVYSPAGPDGYPRRIFDRESGVIDRETAEYWHENYDLFHILQRDWATLGPKLRGKLQIYVGDMDNYYLNNAVYGVEKFLKSAEPAADAVVEYGDRDEHCWNGDHTRANAYSRLRYPQMVLPWMVKRMLKTAPAGADIKSWRY